MSPETKSSRAMLRPFYAFVCSLLHTGVVAAGVSQEVSDIVLANFVSTLTLMGVRILLPPAEQSHKKTQTFEGSSERRPNLDPSQSIASRRSGLV